MTKNRLSQESSPYLLQHKDNPVHWWAWGTDALSTAQSEDKPILLSIGYAACHWCHVMAHESFENHETAQLMNRLFINIKVDREERPDIDHIYMTALHHLGEQGGWPLTMFLKPDGQPYWGGTYFPPMAGFGRPSFSQALTYANKLYREDRSAVDHNAASLTQLIAPEPPKNLGPEINDPMLGNILQRLGDMIDGANGGLRGSPKFPQYPLMNYLWQAGLRFNNEVILNNVQNTLLHIFQGGIYDHLGGGLARYAVDDKWLVPHFEKMLYDNALIMDLATEIYQVPQTQISKQLIKRRIYETVEWLKREMLAEGNCFAASLDADSEGEEGKFYVWSYKEVEDLLGPEETEFFAQHYDLSQDGNWEGKTILNRLNSLGDLSIDEEKRLKQARDKLLSHRSERIPPGRDDKILTDWNGLMIAALAKASFVFEESEWLQMAETAFAFITTEMSENDQLCHSYRLGQSSAPAMASDYAFMIRAALSLFHVTQKRAYIDQAIRWVKIINDQFWCADYGGYFMTSKETEDVLVRGKTGRDDAVPGANGVMASNLMALYLLTGDEEVRTKAHHIIPAFGAQIAKDIFSHIGLLTASIHIMNPLHLVIVGEIENEVTSNEAMRALIKETKSMPLPHLVLEQIESGQEVAPSSPAFGKSMVESIPAAYLCQGETCLAPITDAAELKTALQMAVKN